MRHKSSAAVAAAGSLLLLAGCVSTSSEPATTEPAGASDQPTAQASAASAAPQELAGDITFMAHVTPNRTKEFWQKQVDAFTAANPAVNVTMQFSPDTDAQAYLKSLLASGDVPDVASNIDVPTFRDQLTTWDLSDPQVQLIRDVERQQVDGSLYGLGVDAQPRNTVFYNVDQFTAAGVTTFPTTWQEFDAAMAALQDAGFVPLCGAGEWVTGRIFMGLNNIFTASEDWYEQRAAGQTSFSDPDWTAAAERFRDWAAAGYFGEGALGTPYAQAEQNFLQGKCAMYQMGIWFTGAAKATPPDFEVGVAAAPSEDGTTRLSGGFGTANFVVLNSTENPEAAKALATFLAFDPTNHQEQMETDGLVSSLTIADQIAWNYTPLQQAVLDLMGSADSSTIDFIGGGDNIAAPGTVDAINVLAQAILADPASVDIPAQLAELDRLWDENAKGGS